MVSRRMELPSSQGGLKSYAGQYNSKYQIPPIYVLAAACVIALAIILMHFLRGV